jgi:hypothetical protein
VAGSAARLNLVGSLFFAAAAAAAFVSPATDDAVAAGVANGGTLLGALCFLRGARLLLPLSGRSSTGEMDQTHDAGDGEVSPERAEEYDDDRPPVPPGP